MAARLDLPALESEVAGESADDRCLFKVSRRQALATVGGQQPAPCRRSRLSLRISAAPFMLFTARAESSFASAAAMPGLSMQGTSEGRPVFAFAKAGTSFRFS